VQLAKNSRLNGKPALQNDAIRQKIADWYSDRQGLRNRYFRTITALSKGELPGPENAIGKIVTGKQMQDLSTLAMEIMGEEGILREDNPLHGAFQAQWMWAAGLRIAGGTDEILRNIIAERVLGLPPDVRVDKEKSFRELDA
jgi:alkylation response protein AidB-like acyl-CoA dehydrogenase